MSTKTYVGDTNRVIEVETSSTLTGYTPYILVKKPDNTTATWTGSIASGSTTKITYSTLVTDLTVAGTYYIQSYVNGIKGETASFVVYGSFK
jgi:hypothetical protein